RSASSRDHSPAKARAAAIMARSRSWRVASGQRAKGAPVAGLMTSKCWRPATSSPSMRCEKVVSMGADPMPAPALLQDVASASELADCDVHGREAEAERVVQRLVEKGEGGAVELLHDGAHPLLGFSAGRPLGDDGAHHVAGAPARRFTVASAPPSWARVRRNDGAWRWRPMPSAGAPPRPGSPRSRWSRTEEAAPARGGCLRRPSLDARLARADRV